MPRVRYILIFLAILLVISVVLNLITPKTEPTPQASPTPKPQTSPSPSGGFSQLFTPTPPPTPLPELTPEQRLSLIPQPITASQLAEKLSLNPHETAANTWINPTTKESVFYQEKGEIVMYSHTLVPQKTGLTQSATTAAAKKFLDSINYTQAVISKDAPTFLSEGFEPETTTAAQAKYAVVSFLLPQNPPGYQTGSVWITSDLEIAKAILPPNPQSPQ